MRSGGQHGTWNPVFDHELLAHRRLFRKLGPNRAVHVVVGLCLVAAYVWLLVAIVEEVYGWAAKALQHDADGLQVAGLWGLLLLSVMSPGLTAPTLVTERHRGSWDLLRLSRLSPTEIVVGKYLGRLAPALDLALLSMPVMVLLAMIAGQRDGVLWLVLIGCTWTATLVGFSAVGLWCSARARNTASAVASSYGIAVVMILVLPIAEAVLLDILGVRWADHGPIATVMGSPLAAYVIAWEGHSTPADMAALTCLAQPVLAGLVAIGLITASIRHMTNASADEMRLLFQRRRKQGRR